MDSFSNIDNVRWLPMTAALLCSLGLFAYVMFGKFKLLTVAKHRPDLFRQLPKRLSNMFIYALGQKKMFKEPAAGFMHAFIFWGFLVLQIRTLYLIILAYDPTFHFPGQLPYTFAKDITEVIVLAMCCYAAYRRLITKPKRLSFSGEALIILAMIGGLMATDFFIDAFLFAGKQSEAIAAGTTLEAYAPGVAAELQWAPIGGALAGLFEGMDPQTARIGFEVFYWTHIFIVLTFLNLLPGSKHFHVITALPNTLFTETRDKGALWPIEDIERQEKFGVGDVRDFDWRDYLDLYTCTECGRCTVNCPTTITGKPLNPKYLIIDIRDHLYDRENEILGRGNGWSEETGPSLVDSVKWEAIWDCTTCRACAEACPVNIEHVDKIVDMRRHLLLMEASFPEEFTTTLKSLEQKGNPWGLPQSQRTEWMEGLEVPSLEDNPDAEYVFWVGCAGAYDDKQKKVSRALVEILQKANVSFAVLGEVETCTGDPARRAGNEYLFQILAKTNIEILKDLGVDKKKLVTHCPHCFNTIQNEYPQFGGQFEVVHHSTLIDRLVADGRITPRKTPDGVGQVTYHDSCYLGRYNDVYEEPRKAIKSIPGLDLKEMARNRTTGMCCGAGGSRVWMEEHRGNRINQERVNQAMEVQPDTIAVACPFCRVMLHDGVNELQIEGVETKDIAELVNESLG